MPSFSNIIFIGGGNMANAIFAGCLHHGFNAHLCHVVDINAKQRAFIETQWGVKTSENITDIADLIQKNSLIILAVKPQHMFEVTAALKKSLHSKPLILSIAAGVCLTHLSECLGGYNQIIRAMPNMAALVHKSITGLAALPTVNATRRLQANDLLRAIGDVIWLTDENQLDAVTAISGSGPAYVFYFIEALQQAGESLGLQQEQARQLALKTFEGASYLAITSAESVTALREKVTSKGGTTEAALKYLDHTEVKQHVIEAVKTAASRARELGKSNPNRRMI